MVYLGVTFLLIVIVITATVLIVHIGFRAPRRIEHNSPADYGLVYEEIHIRTTAGKHNTQTTRDTQKPLALLRYKIMHDNHSSGRNLPFKRLKNIVS